MKTNNPQITPISTEEKKIKEVFICANRPTELTTKSGKSADKKYFQASL